MGRLVIIVLSMLFSINLMAQGVESKLRAKFSSVQWHADCGGWYLVSEEKNGQTLYGLADSKGNVIASGATRYKQHPGFIELYLLDAQKKALHTQWQRDMDQYNKDYATYRSVEAKYESEVAAYNTKVEAAKSEATRRWNIAKKQATEQAQREAAALQQQTGGSTWGAILGGVLGAVNTGVAAAAVKYEPFLNQVLAERDLLVEPHKPYNPVPQRPVEPETGWYWARYSLRQPVNYEYVDFDKITEVGTFADVMQGNRWGLVDAYMNLVVPCTNDSKVLQGKIFDNYLIKMDGLYGVINSKSKYIVPAKYRSIKSEGSCYMVQSSSGYGLLDKNGKEIMPCIYQAMTPQHSYLLCKKDNKWGVYTSAYVELYPCQFQDARLWKVNDKLVLMHKDKGLWGATDFNSGVELLPNKYENVKSVKFDNKDYYMAIENGLHGLYNGKGILIIPCSYSSIESKKVAGDQMLEVKCTNGSIGLFHINGINVLEPGKYTSYEWVWLSSEDSERFVRGEESKYTKYASSYYKVKSAVNSLHGVCNEYGQELIPCNYTSLERRGNCFVATKMQNGREVIGCISYLGQELFPFVEANSIVLHDDYCVVNTPLGSGALDYSGNLIVPFKKKNPKISEKIVKLKMKNPGIEAVAEAKGNILNADYNKSRDVELAQWRERKKFSFYAQNYVERIINDWQRKGEFEKIEEWRKRVNNNTMKQKVFMLTKEAQDMYISESSVVTSGDTPEIVGNYDPDNETFRIKTKYSSRDILVKVDPDDAQEFKSSFASMSRSPKFFIDNDGVALAEYVFIMPTGKKYIYSDSASLTHSVAAVNYNFDAIEIDKSSFGRNNQHGRQTISTGNFVFGTSDVDVNIPTLNREAPNTFAVIIANENYDNEKNVDFAFNDGQVFRDYCERTLGLPAENIHFRSDATLNNMKYEVNWIKEVSKVNDNAKFIFYYAGHGVPDEQSKEAYLLPVDGYVEDAGSGYKLSELYGALGDLEADNVLVLLDACFTGTGRDDEMLASVRGVRITPKTSQLKGNMVVFTATSSNQTAHPYVEQSHGLFTYYLLKGMQQAANSGIELGDWFNYIKTEVGKKALLIKSKAQTPTVNASPAMMSKWKIITM